jgi:light-regulated signal transduction histidine kinase (bacteriophytochrome)
MELNTPQQNRILMIQEEASRINNLTDCDVIQDAKETLANAQDLEDVLQSVDYLIEAINYRTGETVALKRIIKLKKEIKEYASMLSAIQSKNPTAIQYFEREAKNGTIRIM